MFNRIFFLPLGCCCYLVWRVFAGEHPRPGRVHVEGPACGGTAVQGGPGDGGPAGVTQHVLFGQLGGACGEELLGFLSTLVLIQRVVLLRERRLGAQANKPGEGGNYNG